MCADFGSFGSTIQENGKLLSSNEDTGTVRVAEVDGVLDRECRCGPEWLLRLLEATYGNVISKNTDVNIG